MLGPVLDRLNNEILDPLISLVFERMIMLGLVPPLPAELDNVGINVDYISILAQSQKAITTNAVDRFMSNLGVLAGMKGDILDKVDFDYWADYYADSLGIDTKLIVPGKQVALIRQKRAEVQAQQQQMAMAEQAAKVASDISDMQSMAPQEISNMFSGY